ncbi:MAG: hypothetical protein ACI9JY_002165 [Saprospiraceae bacterium]|jgi:hypothetical protein
MKNLWFCLLLSCSTTLFSQEQLGLKLENYAGINGVTLNPASNLTNPLRIDINLISFNVFVDNNYLFIKNTNTLDLIKNGNGSEFYSAPDFTENTIPDDGYVIDYFNDSRKRHASVLVNVMGPSFIFKIGEQHSVGLFTAVRGAFSTQDVPNEFSYYKYDQIPFNDEFSVAPFTGSVVAWSEIGVNYAYKIPTYNGFLGIGINARYLQGYEALYFENNRTAGYTKTGNKLLAFNGPKLSFGYTNGNLNFNEDFNLERNGSGFAFDIGANWVFGKDDNDYVLKLGASLIDFGYIKFDKNSRDFEVSLNIKVDIDGDAYENLTEGLEVQETVEIFSTQTLGSPVAAFKDRNFTANLPAALSFQADYSITPNIFINGILIQRIPFQNIIPSRGNLLAVTPRFEHRWFSASLPLVLYNWQDFRVGLASRLGYLIIGTDNLGSWVGKSDYTGTDIYAGLKFNLGELNFVRGSAGNRKRRKGPKVKCYF